MKQPPGNQLSDAERHKLLWRMLREGAPPKQERERHWREAPIRPRDAFERKVSSVLAAELGLPVRGVYRSIPIAANASRLASAIEETFGITLSEALPEEVSLVDLACLIRSAMQPDGLPIDLDPESDEPVDVPLTPAQNRLWFLHQLEGPSATHNLMLTLHMVGFLDVALLRQLIHELGSRHRVLRSCFHEVDGVPRQSFPEGITFPFTLVDLSGLDHKGDFVIALKQLDGDRPFLLDRPLLRFLVLRLGPEEHFFQMCLHRIIADSGSMRLMLRELAEAYSARLHARETQEHEVVQFSRFARFQRKHMVARWQDQATFWQQRLQGIPELHQLHLDRPRSTVRRFQGKRIQLKISARVVDQLKDIAKAEGTDLFNVMQAAFCAFLSRYSQSDHIVLGTATAKRLGDAAHMLGPCTNPLVLQAYFQRDLVFLDLVHQVRLYNLQAFANSDMPFEKIVELVRPERDLSHAPLFQLFFQLDPFFEVPKFDGLIAEERRDAHVTARHELALRLWQQEGLSGYLEYNAHLFDNSTVSGMKRHFKHFLRMLAASPDKPMHQLPLMPPDEQETVLVDWNTTAINMGPRMCAHDLFQRQVEETPQALAIWSDDASARLTYDALNRRANRLAHHLLNLGVGPEKAVALCCRRSPGLIVGLLAIFKAGGAVLPLHETMPRERLRFMLEDSGAVLLMIDERYQGLFEDFDLTRVFLGRNGGPVGAGKLHDTNPVGPVRDYHCASLLYTSGAEGYPKGCINIHRALVNRLRWSSEVFPMKPTDRMLQLASFGSDIALWELLAPVVCGAQLVPGSFEVTPHTDLLAQLIINWQISVVHLLPNQLMELLKVPGFEKAAHLQRVFCGGDRLTLATIRAFYKKLKCRLIHLYGPTETTVSVTASWCRPDLDEITLGRPIANTTAYVLDRYMQPVPEGVPGQLYIGGLPLSRGFENQVALTALSFVPNPFAGDHPFAGGGTRLYRTGDLALLRPRGNILYLGRLDRQVKINGFRVELSEVERVLEAREDVLEAVVVVHRGGSAQKRLVAYLKMEGEFSSPASLLRPALIQHLPEYMIPASFIALEEIPRNSGGHPVLESLPKPDESQFTHRPQYVPPRNSEEHLLSVIWGDILGVERVGIHDNFFHLGGDSMMVIRMEAQAAQSGVHLNPRQLFEKPTIAELVGTLDTESQSPLPPNLTVHEAFSQRVVKHGMHPALIDEEGDVIFSFADLERLSDVLARRLMRLKPELESAVVVCCRRPVDLLLGMLAVMKVGCFCVPIAPSWSNRYKRSILDLVSPAAALVDSSEHLSDCPYPLLLLHAHEIGGDPFEARRLSGHAAAMMTLRGDERSLSGVVLSHTALLAMLRGLEHEPRLDHEDRFMLPGGMSQGIHPMEMLLPLLRGATLLATAGGVAEDPMTLNRLLKDHAITALRVVDSVLPALTSAMRPGSKKLRLLVYGHLRQSAARALCRGYDEVWHFHGFPEAAHICTRGQIGSDDLGGKGSSVGVPGPLHNCTLFILDEKLRFVPPGVAGQLYVGGLLLARGYWQDARQTASLFIPDPLTRGVAGARLFKTGLRAFFNSNGRLIFI